MEHSVKFETKVKQGVIYIPEEYKNKLKEGTQVIVIINSIDEANKKTRLMDKFAEKPISVTGEIKLTREKIHER
ncbi:MAG: hypothetical protein AB4057_00370 [Crocosphaera sp.]